MIKEKTPPNIEKWKKLFGECNVEYCGKDFANREIWKVKLSDGTSVITGTREKIEGVKDTLKTIFRK